MSQQTLQLWCDTNGTTWMLCFNTCHLPPLCYSSLSTSELVKADYIGIYDKHKVNFCRATTTKILSDKLVLKGWQCLVTKLWRVPLVYKLSNFITGNTLILDHPLKLGNCNKQVQGAIYQTQPGHYSKTDRTNQQGRIRPQRIWTAQHRANSAIPTRSSRIPYGENMAKSNRKRKLQLVATRWHHKCGDIFPQVRGNAVWTHARAMPGSTINPRNTPSSKWQRQWKIWEKTQHLHTYIRAWQRQSKHIHNGNTPRQQ